MRKLCGWACFGAALLGWGGLSYGDEPIEYLSDAAAFADGEATFDSEVREACHEDGVSYELLGDGCNSCNGGWFDNTVIFAGADTYKSIGDRLTNINGGTGSLTSSFGGVVGFNSGVGLGDSKLRGQFGASYGVYDLRGRIRLVPEATDVEEQGFFTAGLGKRGDMCGDCDRLSYGAVIDVFSSNNWGINANAIDLGQVRAMVGYALSERFEVGAFGTAHLWDDDAAVTVAGAPAVRRQVRAANQLNAYVRANTLAGGSLMLYFGGFDNADIQDWQFGATGEAPLSSHFSLYGNFNYAVPGRSAGPNGSGEEQFNIQFGLAFYPGGKAVSRSVTGQQGLPLLDLANNGSFLITD